MNPGITPETDDPLSEYTEFWAPADRADRVHAPIAKRTGRAAIIGFAAAGVATLVFLGSRPFNSEQIGQKVAPRTIDGTYIPLPPVETTTTLNPCIVEFQQLSKADIYNAHAQYNDCRDNPLNHTFSQLNAKMTTTTTSQPQS